MAMNVLNTLKQNVKPLPDHRIFLEAWAPTTSTWRSLQLVKPRCQFEMCAELWNCEDESVQDRVLLVKVDVCARFTANDMLDNIISRYFRARKKNMTKAECIIMALRWIT